MDIVKRGKCKYCKEYEQLEACMWPAKWHNINTHTHKVLPETNMSAHLTNFKCIYSIYTSYIHLLKTMFNISDSVFNTLLVGFYMNIAVMNIKYICTFVQYIIYISVTIDCSNLYIAFGVTLTSLFLYEGGKLLVTLQVTNIQHEYKRARFVVLY